MTDKNESLTVLKGKKSKMKASAGLVTKRDQVLIDGHHVCVFPGLKKLKAP